METLIKTVSVDILLFEKVLLRIDFEMKFIALLFIVVSASNLIQLSIEIILIIFMLFFLFVFK